MQGVTGMVLKTEPLNELVWHPILDFYRFLTNFGRLLTGYGWFYQNKSVANSQLNRLNRLIRSDF